MLNIAFCDDNKNTISQLDRIMTEADKIAGWDLFTSGQELLEYTKKNKVQYHIYLLDIEMPGKSGIDTAQEIRRSNTEAVIIFLTDHKEYVYQVFEVLPFRFLQKPVNKAALLEVLYQAAAHIQKNKKLFFYQVGREQHQIPLGEIICFEGKGRQVLLYTGSGQELFYGRFYQVWDGIDKGIFTRAHASFIINMEHIRQVRQDEVLLAGELCVPISKRFKAQFKQDYLQFIERRNGLQ